MTNPPVAPRELFEWIALRPKWSDEGFNGYDQIDGSHIYDNHGQIYRFVPESAYAALVAENERLRVENWVRKDAALRTYDGPAEKADKADEYLKRAESAEAEAEAYAASRLEWQNDAERYAKENYHLRATLCPGSRTVCING
jgi:hypothetical protein